MMTATLILLMLWLAGALATSWGLALLEGEAFDWGIFALDLAAWPVVLLLLLWVHWHHDRMVF